MENTNIQQKSICIVSAQYLPHIGGVENFVFNLSKKLAERGHNVTIVTSSYEGEPNYSKSSNVEIFRLPSIQLMNGRFPVLKLGRDWRAFKREFKTRKFDLMLVNVRFYTLSLFMLKLAKRLGIRAVLIDHGSSHLNTGGKLTSKLSEVFEHAITLLEKRYCREFAGVSKQSLEWLKHFKINSSLVISNAIDIERFESYIKIPSRRFRQEYSIPDGATLISFVGRMTLEKGVPQLVSAVKKINTERNDVWLLCAGDGYLKDELDVVKSEHTVFLGALPSHEVACLLYESDIFCLPSVSEGFPTSVLEACVCKAFVITTKKGDAKEIVTSRNHGIILDDNSEQAVFNAICEVIDKKEYRNNAAELCYNTVKNCYTWDNTANTLLSLLE